MTDISLRFSTFAVPASPFTALRDRHESLTTTGVAFVILAVVTAALPLMDGRLLDGVSVWAKPAKFYLSSGVFMLTSAWLFGLVRPERRATPRLVWSARILIAAACFELGYITLQAARGEPSHFNRSSAAAFVLYGMMGAAAITMLLTKIPLALEIARRPSAKVAPELRRAAVIGVWLTVVLGAASGLYMSQQYGSGHNVGAVGGAAPVFGWNRLGGDLRVAHFFGMHAEQVLPIVAFLSATTASRRWTYRLVSAVAIAIVALTVAVFVQALAGRPFPLG